MTSSSLSSSAGCLEREETRPGHPGVATRQPQGGRVSMHLRPCWLEARQRRPEAPAPDTSAIWTGQEQDQLECLSSVPPPSTQLPRVALESERCPHRAMPQVLPGAPRKDVTAARGSLLPRTRDVPKPPPTRCTWALAGAQTDARPSGTACPHSPELQQLTSWQRSGGHRGHWGQVWGQARLHGRQH